MTEYQKCNNCKGIGRVPAMDRSQRWMTCPICNGKGKRIVKYKPHK